MNDRITALDALAEGSLTLAEAADRLQVSETQVQEWAQLVSLTRELAAHDAPRARRPRPAVSRRAVVSAAVTLVVAVGLWASRPAWAAAGCAQFLPAPLKTFCSNTPALADEVNANFKALTDALSARTGTFSTISKDITTTGAASVGALTASSVTASGGSVSAGSLSATGATSTATLSVSNGVIQRGTPVITATTNLGLYSRTPGAAVQLVANQGEVKMYAKAKTDGTGDGDSFGVNSSGTPVASFGGVSANTPLLPNNFCVVVPSTTTCPSGWRTAASLAWDTEDDSGNTDAYVPQVGAQHGGTGIRMYFCCRGSGFSFGSLVP